MKSEKIKTIDGKTVTIHTPENARDVKEIERMVKEGELEFGGAFADQGEYSDEEIDGILGY